MSRRRFGGARSFMVRLSVLTLVSTLGQVVPAAASSAGGPPYRSAWTIQRTSCDAAWADMSGLAPGGGLFPPSDIYVASVASADCAATARANASRGGLGGRASVVTFNGGALPGHGWANGTAGIEVVRKVKASRRIVVEVPIDVKYLNRSVSVTPASAGSGSLTFTAKLWHAKCLCGRVGVVKIDEAVKDRRVTLRVVMTQGNGKSFPSGTLTIRVTGTVRAQIASGGYWQALFLGGSDPTTARGASTLDFAARVARITVR